VKGEILNEQERWKQLCVLDAVTISNLCKVELKDKKAIQWVIADFRIVFPDYVYHKEAKNYVGDDQEAEIIFKHLTKHISKERIDPKMKGIVTSSFDENQKINRGELEAATLALKLSRLSLHYIILVTDDFKAQPPITEAFYHQQVGSVYSSYDLLLFLYTRHKNELARRDVEKAIADLTALYPDQTPRNQPAPIPQQKQREYLKQLEKLYR
jgi:hypothetical protein